jgi:MATE family multidrug resistance protein
VYLAIVLLIAIVWRDRRQAVNFFDSPLAPDMRRILELLRVGTPAAVQVLLEIGVFGMATALIATLEPASVAAHQIVLNCASFTYMVPLGVSSAAAVRVGQAIGAGDPERAGRAGWTSIALGTAFMAAAAVVFLAIPQAILRVFTPDAVVIRMGIQLFAVAAAFQLFDGLQTVATGALRGAGETRIPMLASLVAYWIIGLPLGWYLGFPRHLGALGIWIGLAISLMVMGSGLVLVWREKARKLRAPAVAMRPAGIAL